MSSGLAVMVALCAVVMLVGTSCRGGDLFESAWSEESAEPHPLLREGALLVRFLQRKYHPSPERYAVRADGADTHLDTLDDLREFLVPIDTARRATQYVELARFLELDGAPPGLGNATPNRGGLSPLFEELVQETWRLRRSVVASDGAFEIDEPVVAAWGDLRLVELRVRVLPDGAVTWEELREVASGPAVDALLFRAR